MKDVTVVLSVFVTVGVCTRAHTDTHTRTYVHTLYVHTRHSTSFTNNFVMSVLGTVPVCEILQYCSDAVASSNRLQQVCTC